MDPAKPFDTNISPKPAKLPNTDVPSRPFDLEVGTLLYPGKEIEGNVVVSVNPDEVGIVTPSTKVTHSQTPVAVHTSNFLPDKYIGFIGRYRYASTDIRSGLVFCGPDGSGRRSLATAIAALHGLTVATVNYTDHVAKWVGQTETGILKAIQRNIDAQRITLLVGMPEDPGEGASATIVDSIYSSLNSKTDVWIIVNRAPPKLSAYTHINLTYGTYTEVKDWCRWYYHDETLASKLTRQLDLFRIIFIVQTSHF